MLAADILNREPYCQVDTSIGNLNLYWLTWGGMQAIRKTLGEKSEEVPSVEYIKTFVPHVYYHVDSLEDKKQRPDEPTITEELAGSLTSEDLEQLSEAYLRHNESMYKDYVSRKTTTEDGEVQIKHEISEEVTDPKQDGESNTDYLCRLLIKEDKKFLESSKAIADSFKKSVAAFPTVGNNFTKMFKSGNSLINLANSISMPHKSILDSVNKSNNVLGMLNSATKATESLRKQHGIFKHDLATLPKLNIPEPPDYSGIFRAEEQRRVAPFKELGEKLDQQIALATETSVYLVEANEFQRQIATELKISGDSTKRLSKWNIGLAIAVLLVSVGSLIFSIYVVSSAGTQQRQSHEYMSTLAEGVRSDLEELNNGLSTIHTTQTNGSKDVINTLALIHTSNSKTLETITNTEEAILTFLSAVTASQSDTNHDLQKELSHLASINSNLLAYLASSQITSNKNTSQPKPEGVPQ